MKISTPNGEYRDMWFNKFSPTERDIKLHELAEEYESKCESYDRAVCCYIDEMTGESVPTSSHQLKLINNHSREVMSDILYRNPAYSRRDIVQYLNKYIYK